MPQYRHVFSLSFEADIPLLNVTWMDNAGSTICVICQDTFHFMKRKHHCRLCGRLVCNQCSKARAAVRPSRFERTCRLCCNVLQTLEALGDSRVQSNTPSLPLVLPSSLSPEHDYDRVMRVRKKLKVYQPLSAQYYIINAEWLQKWFLFIKRKGNYPGAISNHSLLSFYQGKLHAKRGGTYRVIHEHIWCTLHELYGGGPPITTQSQSMMAWSIQMSEGEVARTLIHTNLRQRKPSAMQCWFQTECNRLSLLQRSSSLRPSVGDVTMNAVEAFAAAANQARRDAEGRLSRTSFRMSALHSTRASAFHATM